MRVCGVRVCGVRVCGVRVCGVDTSSNWGTHASTAVSSASSTSNMLLIRQRFVPANCSGKSRQRAVTEGRFVPANCAVRGC